MTLPFPHPSSLSPQFTLSRCTPEDVPHMVSCYLAAFSETDFDYWWPQSVEAMRTWTEKRFGQRFSDPTDQQFKVVDNETRELVACARWSIPKGMQGMAAGYQSHDVAGSEGTDGLNGAEGKWKQAPPEGADAALFHEFFAGIKEMSEKWDAKSKLGLSVLYTDPAYHGRGIAKALIEPVLAIADVEGFTTYLEALSNAKDMYKNKFGFKVVDDLEYDLSKAGREGKAVIEVMIREPKRL